MSLLQTNWLRGSKSDINRVRRIALTGLVLGMTIALSRSDTHATSYQIIHSFNGEPDGFNPQAPLLAGKDGVLYGTTFEGGVGSSGGSGIVFSLTPPATAGAGWAEAVIHAFDPGTGDTAFPVAGVIADANRVLYGTTPTGIYSLTPPSTQGGAWTEAVLSRFSGSPSDGSVSDAPLVLDKGGDLFGATLEGGLFNNGAVFALPATGGVDHLLFSFIGSPDGANPVAGLLPTGGNFVGTTQLGGNPGIFSLGCGTDFKLSAPSTPGNSWTESVLYAFQGPGVVNDGCEPESALVSDHTGVLYGTTNSGPGIGAQNVGTVYSLTPPATARGAWTETTLYIFNGPLDGAGHPIGGVLLGPGGVLYGTTEFGGSARMGSVFSLTPPAVAGGPWTETVLHSFTGAPDGESPFATLVFFNGAIYGTTAGGGFMRKSAGVVFRIVP